MAFTNIKVAIISKAEETSQLLRAQAEATRLATVKLEVNEYCTNKTDAATKQFIEARPDIVILDLQEPALGLLCLSVLHAVLPKAWLLVSTNQTNPQFLIEAVRAGAREFLPKPAIPASLAEAFRRFVDEVQQPARAAADGKIYCVAPAKSGAGATTVAINLATALADAPDTRVALIDLSRPLGDAAAYLNLRPQFSVADALRSADRLDSILLESYANTAAGVAVVAGPEIYHPEPFPGIQELPRLLDVAARTYTHTVLDLPASMEKGELEVLREMATVFLLVLTPELPAVWRADRLLRFLDGFNFGDRLRLVLNRSGKEDQMDQADIRKVLDRPVFWRLPNDYAGAMRALSEGRAAVTLNGSQLARSCREMAQRVSGTVLAEKRRGLFGLFAA